MNLLSLDIATNTGWAMSVNGRTSSGILELPTDDYGHMATAFSSWLVERFVDGVELVVIERPTFRHVSDSSYRCDGLCWTAHQTAWLHEIERREVRPSEWRKAILGNGNLSTDEAKARAMQWCRERGFDPKTHDEAEAIAILHFAIDRWGEGRQAA